MGKFADYILREKIHETRHSIIYRGHKENESQPFIIKLLKTIYPTPSEIARFKQEYELIKNLDLEGVIKTFDIINYDNRFALILEDFNGVSLKSLLDEKKKFDLKSFLGISVKIAETLGKIHLKGIAHRDIKPHNILINPITEAVKITDFGISAILTHENQEIYNPDFITGTLAYMSPEQTGRMNRTVDYRTDLYSFGVTLYEMLTGSLPFKSYDHDPMELIHSHIAVMPDTPFMKNSGIPLVISNMIMRLLAKTPEERYQNGFGVMADIRECSRQLEVKKNIEAFELGRDDISNRFIIPQKLFGREKEIKALRESFEDVTTTAKGTAIMVVAGAPGIGKSSLVNELHKPIVAKRGYFISGKYEQFRRDKPYSAIIQAFQVLVKQILSESEDRISVWKENILKALGTNGKVITDVIPEIELIIGKQPDLPALGPEESKNRFNFVFEKFTSVFPTKDHPIVLFLDDLQWVDIASIHLMKNILISRNIRHLLMIVSYRDNELDDSHPVMGFLKEVEKNNIPIGLVTLGALTTRDVTDLIKYFLRCSEKRGSALAELVVKKTGGNPFFVNQFLHTLYNEKMITQDSTVGWRWDVDKISRMKVTDNLVEMMAGKIGKMSANAREILKICSCIGNRFDLETLAAVRGTSIDQALHDLTEAINQGLVSPLGDMYIFHHDRIQEAAYSLLTDREKSQLHYRIGKLALDTVTEDELQNKLFYIVDQLNLGVKMITDRKEREGLARLNLEAGIKGKASAAYTPAFKYLKCGIGLLEENPWAKQYDLTLALYTESTEAAYLMGDFDKMNELAEIALAHAETTLEKVKIYTSRIYACIAREDFKGAIDMALPGVKLLGVWIPKKPTQIHVAIELMKLKIRLLRIMPEDLLDFPKSTDPEMLALGKILASVGHAAFYTDPNLLALIILKAFGLMFKRDQVTPENAFAFSGFGIVLAVGLWDFTGAIEFGKLGLRLMEKIGARDQECRTIFVYNALVRHWKYPMKDSIKPMLEGYRIGMETGDLGFATFNLFFTEVHHLFTGMELSELEKYMERNNRIIAGLKQGHTLTLQSITWQSILNLLGRCDNPVELTGKAIDAEKLLPLWQSDENRAALSVYWFVKAIMYSVYSEYPLALKASDEYRKYMDAQQGVLINKYAVLLDSVARLMTYKDASLATKIKHHVLIKVNQLKMWAWARSAPMNCLHMYHSMRALYAWVIQGDLEKAENIFKMVIQICRRYEDFIVEGIAAEIIAGIHSSIGDEKKAKHYMTEAYGCYSKWGAVGLMNKLTRMYPDLVASVGRISHDVMTDTSSTTSGSGTLAAKLDLSTVMQVSQTISSEIMLDRLLQKIMHMSIANAGAQRGYLILVSEGKLTIEASEDVDKKEIMVMQSMPLQECESICQAIVNYVHHSGKDVILGNAMREGPFTNDPYIMRTRCKSIVCSPIMNKGKLSCILYMENNLSTDAFTPERLDMLRIFSAQAAISIENARLFELATTDGLTKLYVHRYFQLLLDQEMQNSHQDNKQFALIMMDIDNFKAFNDTYGHQLGDKVLRSVARAVKNISRAEDIAARYGGEEFVMILPETDAQQAMIAAENIRASVAELEISHASQKLHVTISLGVSTFPEHAEKKEALIHAADAALYISKHKGKNCVSLFEKKVFFTKAEDANATER